MASQSAKEMVEAIRELDDNAKAAIGKELAPHIPVTLGRRQMLGVGAAALLGAGGAAGAGQAVEAGVGRAAAADGVVSDVDVLQSGDGSVVDFGNAVAFDHQAVNSATTIGNVTVVEYDSSVSGFTITIPASLEVSGMVIRFIDAAGSAGSNSVDVTSSNWNIDGAGTVTIDASSTVFEVFSDGAEWLSSRFIDTVDAGTVTADDATFGTLNGSFGIRLKQADTPELHRAVTVAVSGNSYHSIYDKASGVDCLGGVVIGKSINSLRITWGDDTTTTISDGDDSPIRGDDGDGTAFSTLPVPALQDAKKVEFRNDDGNPADYGYWVLTV